MADNKTYINIDVVKKIATPQQDEIVVCDNKDYVVVVNFDNSWDNYLTKTARVIVGADHYDIPFTGNQIALPRITDTDKISVGFYANDVVATTPAIIRCRYSILSSKTYHANPPQDVYNQLIELINSGAIRGENGLTPYIHDGYWWIGDENTHVQAKGQDGYSPIVEIEKIEGATKVIITDRYGEHSFTLADGKQGEKGENGISTTHSWNGTVLTVTSASGTSSADLRGEQGIQGIQGIQGPKGDAFEIYKTYPSIALMNFDVANVPEGKIVLISSNEYDPDNARMYVRNEEGFAFLADLSGAQGIQGERGEQGIQGEQGLQGEKGNTGDKGASIHANTATELSDMMGVKGLIAGDLYLCTTTESAPDLDAKKGDVYLATSSASLAYKFNIMGEAGVGVQSIVQTTKSTADGGKNIVTVTLTNGNTSTFEIMNGNKGSTPVKNVDYFTEADKQELVDDVIASEEVAQAIVNAGTALGDIQTLYQHDLPLIDEKINEALDVTQTLKSETWTFTFADGTTVDKVVVLQ